MTEPIVAGITTLEGLMEAFKTQRQRLRMPQWLVDEISGLQHSYTFKLESGQKGLGKTSVPLLCGALKCEIALMPAVASTERKPEDFWSRRSRAARAKQVLMQSPKQRRKIARAAAKARWRKVEREMAL